MIILSQNTYYTCPVIPAIFLFIDCPSSSSEDVPSMFIFRPVAVRDKGMKQRKLHKEAEEKERLHQDLLAALPRSIATQTEEVQEKDTSQQTNNRNM